MLNGISPLLIFSFKPALTTALFSGLAGIPVVGDILPRIGIPIPVYLNEQLTGVFIESESKAIDIDTEVHAKYNGDPPAVEQRGLNNLVTINMFANKDSIMLAVLLAMNDMIFSRVVSQDYAVSYINGSTTIFNGLLHGFSTNQGSNDDLVRIVMQISKSNQSKPTPGSITAPLKKITGAVPIVVPS